MRFFAPLTVGILVLASCRPNTGPASLELPPEIAKASQHFRDESLSRTDDGYAAALKLLSFLQVGHSQDDVENLFGPPDGVHSKDGDSWWVYTLFYSMVISISFDEEGRVSGFSSPLLEEPVDFPELELEADPPEAEPNGEGKGEVVDLPETGF